MGYIKQSDEIITKVTERLDNILESPMTQFLNLGHPVLVDYYNCSDGYSTYDNGTGTVDALLGDNSPLRYHCIHDLPVYGMLRDFLMDLQDNDGLIDFNMELDNLSVLPNTVIPTTYDYIIYRFGNHKERIVLFRVNAPKKTSIKNHALEAFSAKMTDIDSFGNIQKLEKQVVKRFHAKLKNIGTNEKCLLEEEQYQYSERVEALREKLVEQYLDVFYRSKYHALVLHGELEQDYLSYDPWLTHFCITNRLLETEKHMIVLANLDEDDNSRAKYNTTCYHALETKSSDRWKPLLFTPVAFSRNVSNPFSFYGEDTAFKIDIYEETEIRYPRNIYLDFPFIEAMRKGKEESPRFSTIENLILRWFTQPTLVGKVTEEELSDLEHMVLEHDTFCFRVIPMLLYVLQNYDQQIVNAYI